jgi:hypothetical protein
MVNLQNSIQRYFEAGWSKQDTFNSIFNMSDKLSIIEDMKFSFTFDFAIPQNLWADFKSENGLYSLNNHVSLYPNSGSMERKYRLGFRVFPLVRLYKRFLIQELNKVFTVVK